MENEQIESPVEEPTAPPAETEGDTGAPEPDLEAEAAGEAIAEPEKPSKHLQKRFDELVKQREDWRREAEAWRTKAFEATNTDEAIAKRLMGLPLAEPPNKPKSDDFETYDEYVEALTDWKTATKLTAELEKKEREAKTTEIVKARTAFYKAGSAKYADFETVFGNNVPVSDNMADLLLMSESGPDVAYYLGQNPDEAARIFSLSPVQQARELGKLEVKVSTQPAPQRTKTSAPTPTSPVGGKETPSKKLEDMDYENYKAQRMKELGLA